MSKIADDLQQHFADQLHQLLIDAADTMERVDIPIDEAGRRLLSSLLSEVIMGCYSFRMNEDAVVDVCRTSYRALVPELRKVQAKRRKAAAK